MVLRTPSWTWVDLVRTLLRTGHPPGYKSYENTTAYASIVHNWVWHDPSYPGRWFCYAKSVILKRQPSGAYFFTADNNIPTTPADCAWVAE